MSEDTPDLVCPECGVSETKQGNPYTPQGMRLHLNNKHGIRSPAPEKQPKTPSSAGSRKQRVQSSLAVFGIGAGILNSRDGEILAEYIPRMATALDESAKHYEWAEKLCGMLEDAGPMSLLLSAFVPPLILIMANHGLLPRSVIPMTTVLGGPPVPPQAPQATPAGPIMNPDGSVDMFGTHVSVDDMQKMAEQVFGPKMTGANEVPVADNRP